MGIQKAQAQIAQPTMARYKGTGIYNNKKAQGMYTQVRAITELHTEVHIMARTRGKNTVCV